MVGGERGGGGGGHGGVDDLPLDGGRGVVLRRRSAYRGAGLAGAMTAVLDAGMAPRPRLSPMTWVRIFSRMLAIQGSWNYETLIGNGIAFCGEPALHQLPGGTKGREFKEALTRGGAYFNAHPYLAAVAVGALARAELSGAPPDRIRPCPTAPCGPLAP